MSKYPIAFMLYTVSGLTLEPGKRYTQTVEQSFHLSMAALDVKRDQGIDSYTYHIDLNKSPWSNKGPLSLFKKLA